MLLEILQILGNLQGLGGGVKDKEKKHAIEKETQQKKRATQKNNSTILESEKLDAKGQFFRRKKSVIIPVNPEVLDESYDTLKHANKQKPKDPTEENNIILRKKSKNPPLDLVPLETILQESDLKNIQKRCEKLGINLENAYRIGNQDYKIIKNESGEEVLHVASDPDDSFTEVSSENLPQALHAISAEIEKLELKRNDSAIKIQRAHSHKKNKEEGKEILQKQKEEIRKYKGQKIAELEKEITKLESSNFPYIHRREKTDHSSSYTYQVQDEKGSATKKVVLENGLLLPVSEDGNKGNSWQDVPLPAYDVVISKLKMEVVKRREVAPNKVKKLKEYIGGITKEESKPGDIPGFKFFKDHLGLEDKDTSEKVYYVKNKDHELLLFPYNSDDGKIINILCGYKKNGSWTANTPVFGTNALNDKGEIEGKIIPLAPELLDEVLLQAKEKKSAAKVPEEDNEPEEDNDDNLSVHTDDGNDLEKKLEEKGQEISEIIDKIRAKETTSNESNGCFTISLNDGNNKPVKKAFLFKDNLITALPNQAPRKNIQHYAGRAVAPLFRYDDSVSKQGEKVDLSTYEAALKHFENFLSALEEKEKQKEIRRRESADDSLINDLQISAPIKNKNKAAAVGDINGLLASIPKTKEDKKITAAVRKGFEIFDDYLRGRKGYSRPESFDFVEQGKYRLLNYPYLEKLEGSEDKNSIVRNIVCGYETSAFERATTYGKKTPVFGEAVLDPQGNILGIKPVSKELLPKISSAMQSEDLKVSEVNKLQLRQVMLELFADNKQRICKDNNITITHPSWDGHKTEIAAIAKIDGVTYNIKYDQNKGGDVKIVKADGTKLKSEEEKNILKKIETSGRKLLQVKHVLNSMKSAEADNYVEEAFFPKNAKDKLPLDEAIEAQAREAAIIACVNDLDFNHIDGSKILGVTHNMGKNRRGDCNYNYEIKYQDAPQEGSRYVGVNSSYSYDKLLSFHQEVTTRVSPDIKVVKKEVKIHELQDANIIKMLAAVGVTKEKYNEHYAKCFNTCRNEATEIENEIANRIKNNDETPSVLSNVNSPSTSPKVTAWEALDQGDKNKNILAAIQAAATLNKLNLEQAAKIIEIAKTHKITTKEGESKQGFSYYQYEDDSIRNQFNKKAKEVNNLAKPSENKNVDFELMAKFSRNFQDELVKRVGKTDKGKPVMNLHEVDADMIRKVKEATPNTPLQSGTGR